MSKDALDGMKEICQYVRRSEATVMKLIRQQDFPAKKIEGQWMSSKTKIDIWRNQQLDKAS
jgi:hypothetical protein